MKHLGDITQIDGRAVPAADVVIGGSPCQDLSVAGKRAGLAGERSGLYMEQIRIIKEMRSNVRADGHIRVRYPRYMVWENVPGALSSNGCEDFRAVLEEAARIVEPECVIPRPPNGKWTNAGCIMGDGWSLAWRIHDAQYWGVPQRRRRIALVADFGGGSAPEILFEREGLRGDIAEGRAKREGIASDAEGCAGTDDEPIAFKYHQGAKAGNIGAKPGLSPTIHADGGHPPAICIQGNVVDRDANCNGKGWRDDDVSFAINTVDRHAITQPLCIEMTSTQNTIVEDGICPTLTARMGTGGNQVNVVCISGEDVADTLDASYYKGCGERGFKERTVIADRAAVRRLTPLECERLQGYPDGWTDIGEWVDSKGKRHQTTDSARYKALGNSIALPYWRYLLKRISAQFEYVPTMASLFDGIGGFPYLWESINGKGTCVWASEIDEFPMAVTKRRIGE